MDLDDHDAGPAGPDEERAYRAIVIATADLARECALALAGENVLIAERSLAMEHILLRLAEACRIGGNQVAETDFQRDAEVLRLRRQGRGPIR